MKWSNIDTRRGSYNLAMAHATTPLIRFDFACWIPYDGTHSECRGYPTKGAILIRFLTTVGLLSGLVSTVAAQDLANEARIAMDRATTFFQTEIATEGGYLWRYKDDLSLREGEGRATDSMIWIQPPGTPAVGMVYLDAYAATGDTLYLNGAVRAARALVWGQLSTGGWDYRIDFDEEGSKRWHYRRDVEAGDTDAGERRHRSVFDDDTSQSAMRLLMRVDEQLDFKDEEIHEAVTSGLDAFLRVQYPNGAWPQRWTTFPEPDKYPVVKARYPETWSWKWPEVDYRDFYTFNDNAITDVIEVMLEAHRTYGDERYLNAALKAGDFMVLAQMPEPQPTWAQQYNHQMEPAWARRFEPASVTGGESMGVMRTLLDLAVQTGKPRFIQPVPVALAWAKRSLLADGRLARFYELKTNTPLYFVRDTYELTYSDADMPTHYAFKVTGRERIDSIEAYLNRVESEDRTVLAQEQLQRWSGSVTEEDRKEVEAIISTLDDKGRWILDGSMRPGERGRPRIPARIIDCRTFNQNVGKLARFIALTK